MAKGHGMGDQFYITGYDVGGDINSLSRIGGGNTPIEVTDITQSAISRLGGKRDGGMSFMSYFNPSVGRAHERFSALPSADVLASYGHGIVAGNPIANCIAKQVNYDGSRGDDGSYTLNVDAVANAFGLEWGVQLTAGKITHGAAGNVASVDLGSVSPGALGFQMYVHLFAFTGTSVTLKLQDSTDNGAGDAFADVAGATTTALTGIGGVRVAVTGLGLDKFVRVVSVGVFSNAQFLVSVTRNNTQTDF